MSRMPLHNACDHAGGTGERIAKFVLPVVVELSKTVPVEGGEKVLFDVVVEGGGGLEVVVVPLDVLGDVPGDPPNTG